MIDTHLILDLNKLRKEDSNHADVEHLWSREGLTMKQFRRDVRAAMDGRTPDEPEKPAPENVKYVVQAGAYIERKNAEEQVRKLKAAGFEAFVSTMK